MAISTYQELKDAINLWLNQPEIEQSIPILISLAEADIARKLRHWQQEKKVRTSFDEGYEFLPDDWLETIALRHADGTEIQQVGVTEMSDIKSTVRTGKPMYYRVEAGRIEVYPAPDQSYDVDLLYYARVPALSDAQTTNWILVNHPDILLYGSLLQSAPYLGEDGRVTVWGNLYASAIDALQNDSDAARHSGPLRMRVKL